MSEDDLDEEIVNPRDILVRAKALVAAGDHDGALELLLRGLDECDDVPPPYDAMVGRELLRRGDARAALGYLNGARVAFGARLPVEVRRDLGAALLQNGRIEAAGRELSLVENAGAQVNRGVFRAAIDAYKHRVGTELDSGLPTPYRVLVQAEAVFETKDIEGARRILDEAAATHGARWNGLPPAFDGLYGRLCLKADEREAAISYLTRARDNWDGALPVNVRQPLGTALFEIGRFAEAGHELHQAVLDGATIGRAECLIAVNAYRENIGYPDRLDTRFARNLTIVDPDRQIAYVAIGKNACTLLKSTVILNSRYRDDYLAGGETIHRFCGVLNVTTRAAPVLDAGYFRFVVLRDPARRLLSAYLDKIVSSSRADDPYTMLQVARAIREAQAFLGLPDDPARSVTFEEFVRYIAAASDVQCDMHWMPQVNLVGTDLDIYEHVGTVEHLPETLALLASRFGYQAASDLNPALRAPDPHVARFDETIDLSEPYRLLPSQLAPHVGGLPPPERFYTPELRQLIEQRYAADFALYEAALRRRAQ